MTDNFLIVASPRSGSNYLCNLLDKQEGVKCYLEIFHPDEVPLTLYDRLWFGKKYTPQHRDKYPERFVRHLFNHRRVSLLLKHPVNIIGAKLLVHDHQVEHGLKPLFDKINKIIFLERRNKLAWHASFRMALTTGDWFNHPGKNQDQKIDFDERTYISDIKAETEYFNKIISKLSLTRHQYIHLYYEDIRSPETINKIANFLNISSIHLPETSHWSAPRNFLTSFSNPEMVRAFAINNSLSHWLE